VDPLLPFVVAHGWAAGVNVYAVVLLLNLGSRAGLGDVPEEFASDPVLIAAAVMYAVEFVTDKIPYVDHVWDAIHTAIRPTIAAALALLAAGDAGTVEQALYAAGGGTTAIASHGVKAGLRLAVNTSPEPVTTVTASLVEDMLVASVVLIAFAAPWVAAAVAVLLLAGGIALVTYLWRRIRDARRRWRERPG
jgi:hypothetical protein